jgi:integrase/recombinase XerC
MRDHLSAFLQHLAARRSPRTIKTYGAILAAFAAFAGTSPPARHDVETFLGRRRRNGCCGAPATRNQELAALRAFAQFAKRDLGWTTNHVDGVPFVREAPRDPPVLSMFELRRLFTVAAQIDTNSASRARVLAILALLSQAGLRVHELVALDAAQVDVASATLVSMRGKGGTVQDVPVSAATLDLVLSWFPWRAELAVSEEPALFVGRAGRRISIRAVQRLVAKLRAASGSAKRITPHTFRHTTATLALTLGADLSTVGDLLRHSDLNTTRRYLHLVDERRREAVGRLAVAIPAELLHERRNEPEAPSAGPQSNVRALPWPLDAQHGLDDAA